jgi:hypothetical protein
MSPRSDPEHESGETSRHSSGLGSFLKSLLSGIPWSESVSEEETFTLPRPAGHRLSIQNSNGRTRVIGEDRDDVEIFVEKHARAENVQAAREVLERIQIHHAEVGGNLEVEVDSPSRWNRHGSAHLTIKAPRELELTVVATNGRVCLEGLRASVHARSSNGPVSIQDVVGDVEVFTSNAKVSCGCTSGRLKARSSNSKIDLSNHRGSVDAATSNGVINAVVSELSGGGISLATSNGRIMLELPDSVDADVDARVENGAIRNALAVDQAGGDSREGRLRGKLGRGGPPIKLRTSNGTISLR